MKDAWEYPFQAIFVLNLLNFLSQKERIIYSKNPLLARVSLF
jgi:hypothetical protein